MAIQMQWRRGTAAQWTATNPILASGEVGLETDTSKWKVGNGSSVWTALAYMTGAAPDPAVWQAKSEKGAASGYASLDGTTKVPLAQVPTMDAAHIPDLSTTYQTTAQKGQTNGYASLDAGGLVPLAQLPSSELAYAQITSSVTLGTSWTTIVTSPLFTVDGNVPISVEFWAPYLSLANPGITTYAYVAIYCPVGTSRGQALHQVYLGANTESSFYPVHLRSRFFPPAGSIQAIVQGYSPTTGGDLAAASLGAGGGGGSYAPAFVRVTRG